MRDPLLGKYLNKVKILITRFDNYVIKHIPCEENARDGLLSKLDSAKKLENDSLVIQKVLDHPSINQDEVAAIELGND